MWVLMRDVHLSWVRRLVLQTELEISKWTEASLITMYMMRSIRALWGALALIWAMPTRANYEGNRIKLNQVLSHFIQALGTNLIPSNTNFTKMDLQIGEKVFTCYPKNPSIISSIGGKTWRCRHVPSYLYISKVLGFSTFVENTFCTCIMLKNL